MNRHKKRSKAWNEFHIDGKLACCKQCNQLIRHSGSTSNLINHLKLHEMKVIPKNQVKIELVGDSMDTTEGLDEIVVYEGDDPDLKKDIVEEVAPFDEIETVDVDTACRICLADVQSTIHVGVYDPIKSLGNLTYLEIFKEFTGFDVILEEPQHFCAGCARKLVGTYELKQKCIETQKLLEEFSKNEEMKVEEEEKKEVIKEIAPGDFGPDVDYIIEELEQESIFGTESELKYNEFEVLEEVPKKMVVRTRNRPILSQEKWECHHCPSLYRSKRGLREHYRQNHSNEEKLECPHCIQKFYSPFIEGHRQNCRKANIPTVCPICGVFVDPRNLQRHIDAHKSGDPDAIEKPYLCDICGIRTVAKCGMASHMQIQHLNYRIRCQVCFVEFKTPSVLTSHIRKYHPELKSPLKCKICDFTTTDASVLRRHHLYHLGKKQHKCEICGREFRAKDVLRDHMTTHSDLRPFPCSVCKSTYKTRKALGVHMKTHRAHEYECPVCQKSYLTNQQMRNHVKRAHPEYELPPPGTIFNKNWRIRKARDEMKEMAIKEGVDAAVVESIVIVEPPPIESKMYFRANYVNVDQIEEL